MPAGIGAAGILGVARETARRGYDAYARRQFSDPSEERVLDALHDGPVAGDLLAPGPDEGIETGPHQLGAVAPQLLFDFGELGLQLGLLQPIQHAEARDELLVLAEMLFHGGHALLAGHRPQLPLVQE